MTVKTTIIGDRCVLYGADCLELLRYLPDNSVDSIVTDPPAGIAFMGKDWDKDKGGRDAWIAWMQEIAVECLRVIKDGGHALVWALPRTSHWTGMAWENAGWEPRDKIVHLFGTGFPKSLNVGKAIDKAAGAKREVVGIGRADKNALGQDSGWNKTYSPDQFNITAPATEAAKQWEGWGTALKPASEDWWLLRKPLSGTVAANVLEHGTGALNIDACRVGYEAGEVNFDRKQRQQNSEGAIEGAIEGAFGAASLIGTEISTYKEAGRWPANVITDGSDEVVGLFPQAKGMATQNSSPINVYTGNSLNHSTTIFPLVREGYNDSGSAARFFYCAKTSTADRDEGLEHLPEVQAAGFPMRSADGERGGEGLDGTSTDRLTKRRNTHPTVKSTELMRYLTRLITQPNGVCLDPFMGSGSTGKACMLEGFRFIGIEKDPNYCTVAEARIRHALTQTTDDKK